MNITDSLRLLTTGKPPSDVEDLCLDGAEAVDKLGELAPFDKLTSLSLNCSRLSSLQGFPCLPRLRTLLLSDNRISTVDPLAAAGLSCLEKLVLSGNRIKAVEDLAPLSSITSLKTLDVQFNEFTSKVADYRAKLFELVPNLEVVDERNRAGEEVRLDEDDEEDEDDDEDEGQAAPRSGAANSGSDSDSEADGESVQAAGASAPSADDEDASSDDDDDSSSSEQSFGLPPPRGGEESDSGPGDDDDEDDAAYRSIMLGNNYQEDEGDDDFMPAAAALDAADVEIEDEDEDDLFKSLPSKRGLPDEFDDAAAEPPEKR